jgi:hypothetical protein
MERTNLCADQTDASPSAWNHAQTAFQEQTRSARFASWRIGTLGPFLPIRDDQRISRWIASASNRFTDKFFQVGIKERISALSSKHKLASTRRKHDGFMLALGTNGERLPADLANELWHCEST